MESLTTNVALLTKLIAAEMEKGGWMVIMDGEEEQGDENGDGGMDVKSTAEQGLHDHTLANGTIRDPGPYDHIPNSGPKSAAGMEPHTYTQHQ